VKPLLSDIERLRRQVAVDTSTVENIDCILAGESERLAHGDNARTLRDLKLRVIEEADRLGRMELAASNAFYEAKLWGGLIGFTFGGIKAAASGTGENPLAAALRQAAGAMNETRPHETLAVLVGPQGLPDDVTVVSVSEFARDLGHSEASILAGLRAQSYVVYGPAEFLDLLDDFGARALQGEILLPLPPGRFPQLNSGEAT